MKVGELVDGYREGILTWSELFGWFTERLLERPEERAAILASLDPDPKLRSRFEAWLRGMTVATEILHHGELLRPTPRQVANLSGPVIAPPRDPNADSKLVALVALETDAPIALPARSFVAVERLSDQRVHRWSGVMDAILASNRVVAATLSLLSAKAPPLELGERLDVYFDGNQATPALVTGAQTGAGGLPTDDNFLQ